MGREEVPGRCRKPRAAPQEVQTERKAQLSSGSPSACARSGALLLRLLGQSPAPLPDGIFPLPPAPEACQCERQPRDRGRSHPSGKRFSCYRVSRNERVPKALHRGDAPLSGLNSGQQIQARGVCLKTALGFHLLRDEHSGSKYKFGV